MRPQPTQLPRSKTGVYGLVGRAISYSLSPLVFRKAFDALGWPAVYGLFDLSPVQLPRFVAAAADAGITGFNVTQPYKVCIMRYLDRTDPDADAVGAVNTVVCRGRSWVGHNTDVDGIHEALSRYRDDLRKAKAIIIGAGGAARAAASALANRLAMSEVTFAVRSLPKGRAVVRELSRQCRTDCRWNVCSLTRSTLNERLTDTSLLVNATPVGGAGLEHRSPVPQGVRIPRSAVVFDLVYNPRQTRLLADAASAGCGKLVDGWGMLVAQADASLFLWTGTRFPERVKADLLAMENLR
jgi:shikimate dehydrogenase